MRDNNKEQKRTTPELITELHPNEIFVFGSNLKGMHGGGAAYIAYRKFGAIMGQGVGLQWQSYGIPTMQGGVETIRPYVDEFIAFLPYSSFITLHGLPTAIVFEGMSFTTTEPAPILTLSPIETPGSIVTLPPIQTLLPIVTGFAHS